MARPHDVLVKRRSPRRVVRRPIRLLLAGLAGIALLAQVLCAQTETLKLDPAKTAVQFELHHLLGKVTGTFHGVRGSLHIDRENPENSSVTATVISRTVDTGNRTRDQHLRTELFESVKYPEIIFRSRSVKRVAADRAEVAGDLTMHGITKPYLLHVVLLHSEQGSGGQRARWHISGGTLKRSDFGLTWSRAVEAISVIGEDISVQIDAESISDD